MSEKSEKDSSMTDVLVQDFGDNPVDMRQTDRDFIRCGC